ncbi:hypothetical protein PbJCM13498_36860 [Prolixibacter bellariivorans]|uniref:Uncharacterized protein n=1 Tax=Prolixibacter bellariivorans TaxID=314319 RepID=A0A5M4B4P4_9BACT|nr:hypothetical protein [Prolixibacter bellariivorans]GET34823.1 hypothetical protein PbJCM13498_36860 [Prolixibacter bellariivorans]
METVWDYHPTAAEIEELALISQENYKQVNHETANLDLFLLFSYRKENEKAAVYFNRLSDETKQPFITQSDFDC